MSSSQILHLCVGQSLTCQIQCFRLFLQPFRRNEPHDSYSVELSLIYFIVRENIDFQQQHVYNPFQPKDSGD